MDLIDEKGKVLGIINIIDLTILLFLVSVITGFFWLVYTGELFKDHDPVKRRYVYLNVTALLLKQTYSDLQLLEQEIIRQDDDIRKPKVFTIFNATPSTIESGVITIPQKKQLYFDVLLMIQIPTKFDALANKSYYFFPVNKDLQFDKDVPHVIITAGVNMNVSLGNRNLLITILDTT